MSLGFPRAPLTAEFLLTAFSGAHGGGHGPADVVSPGHSTDGKFLVWEMPSVGLCPSRGVREVLSFPKVQKGSIQGSSSARGGDEGVCKSQNEGVELQTGSLKCCLLYPDNSAVHGSWVTRAQPTACQPQLWAQSHYSSGYNALNTLLNILIHDNQSILFLLPVAYPDY